jgi:hypothetical protein
MGDSLDVLKQKFEDQRDREFAAHVCTERLKGVNSRG